MSKQANPDLDKKKLDSKGQLPQENMQSQAPEVRRTQREKGFLLQGVVGRSQWQWAAGQEGAQWLGSDRKCLTVVSPLPGEDEKGTLQCFLRLGPSRGPVGRVKASPMSRKQRARNGQL